MAAIGVDFGTCFSSASILNGDSVMELRAKAEKRRGRIPSVFYHDAKRTLVGSKAKEAGERQPQFAVHYIKKMLGETSFRLDDREYTPGEIVREMFQYVISGAEESLAEEFHRQEPIQAVITVPVSFSEPRKDLIRGAASQVQLASGGTVRILAVIPEPVAASMEYFGVTSESDRNILVYDLGGGTFDVAIVEASASGEQPYKVIGQDGKGIGGNDWDMRLINLIREKLLTQLAGGGSAETLRTQAEESGNADRLLDREEQRLLAEANRIKEELTELDEVTSQIPIRGEYYDVTVTRKEFEEATRDLREETVRIVSHLLNRHKDRKVEEIVLVGGSSRMPQIMEALRVAFPEHRIQLVNPELAISNGAARYADMLVSRSRGKDPLQLRATHTYGIALKDKGELKIFNVIYRGQELEAKGTCHTVLGQESRFTRYAVYESDCAEGEAVVPLERGTEIMGITIQRRQAAPKGTELTASVTLNKDNLLEIAVTDRQNGKKISRQLKTERKIV